jgi:hypothetical protein
VADGVELVRGEAEESVFGKATVAEQAGEDARQDGVAVVEVAVDAAALLAEPGFQFPQVRGFRDPPARSLASRRVPSSSRLRAKSKALWATAFSAGVHFQSRGDSRLGATAGLCAPLILASPLAAF